MRERTATGSTRVYQESAGLVVMNIDSVPLAGVFDKRHSFYQGIFDEWIAETTYAGFTGDCYYRWGGQDMKWNPGSGILAYVFDIHTPGHYQIRLRNRHDNAHDSTESNDAFMRVDGEQWWKVKSLVHGQWTWDTWYERSLDPLRNDACRHHFARGRHRIEISGRSNGFCLDRLLVEQVGADGRDVSLATSAYRVDTTPHDAAN